VPFIPTAAQIAASTLSNKVGYTTTALRNTPQAAVNGVLTPIQLDLEYRDDGNWHSTTVNNERITPTDPGSYSVSGRVIMTGMSGTGFVIIRLVCYTAAGAIRDAFVGIAGDSNINSTLSCAGVWPILDVGDYFQLECQSSATGTAGNYGVGFLNVVLLKTP
jgi:hypothetical protein